MYYSGIVKVLPPPNFIPALYKVLAEIQDTGTIGCHMDVCWESMMRALL